MIVFEEITKFHVINCERVLGEFSFAKKVIFPARAVSVTGMERVREKDSSKTTMHQPRTAGIQKKYEHELYAKPFPGSSFQRLLVGDRNRGGGSNLWKVGGDNFKFSGRLKLAPFYRFYGRHVIWGSKGQVFQGQLSRRVPLPSSIQCVLAPLSRFPNVLKTYSSGVKCLCAVFWAQGS